MLKIYENVNEIKHKPDDIFLHFTGNIFGIGCSAFDEDAVKKIAALKQRDETKGFIVLFDSFDQAKKYQIPLLNDKKIYTLLNQYMPGNLTVTLHTDDKRFENVWVDHKIAIRIPTSKLLREFIKKIETPIVSTSINIANEPICNDLQTLQTKYEHWFDFAVYDKNETADVPIPSTLIDIDKEYNIKCLRQGSIPLDDINYSFQKPLIQFVCIGNICRSPLAEFYMKKRLKEEKIDYRVASSGTHAIGDRISQYSRTILKNHGISDENKHSIKIDENIVRESAIILCMAEDIKRTLIQRYPNAKNKIFTIAQYADDDIDIDDPFG